MFFSPKILISNTQQLTLSSEEIRELGQSLDSLIKALNTYFPKIKFSEKASSTTCNLLKEALSNIARIKENICLDFNAACKTSSDLGESKSAFKLLFSQIEGLLKYEIKNVQKDELNHLIEAILKTAGDISKIFSEVMQDNMRLLEDDLGHETASITYNDESDSEDEKMPVEIYKAIRAVQYL